MFDLGAMFAGLEMVLNWNVLLFIFLGMIVGILVGAIPGLTASTGMALLVPITYGMDPINALGFLGSVYAGANYGGSISAILLNTPGTPAASITAFDGYPMRARGEANRALGLSLGSSVFGGAISYFAMFVIMYPLAAFAVRFGSPELFLLAVLGLMIIASLKGEKEGGFWKGIIVGVFGILLGTVGIATTGAERGAFGYPYLLDGIPLVPTLIGFLAFSELMVMVTTKDHGEKINAKQTVGMVWRGVWETLKYPFILLYTSVIGIIVGALPAAGATIANFISYNEAKKYSRKPELFGKGAPDGLIASGGADNASTGGAMTTMLALGIPGSESTALMMGAMTLHGLTPGPKLFIEQLDLTYAIIFGLLIAQVFMLFLAVYSGNMFSKILNLPTTILVPCVAIFCVVGSYAVRNTLFDVFFMIACGMIGYLMKKNDYPVIGVVLGLVLGPMADREFILTSIRYKEDYSIFFTRPISIGILVLIALAVIFPLIQKMWRKKKGGNSWTSIEDLEQPASENI